MAFQKNKVTQYGVTAGYWTLLRCEINAFPQGNATSIVTYGLFSSHEDYNAGKSPLEQVTFGLPYETAIPMAYPILPDLENYIRSLPGQQIGSTSEVVQDESTENDENGNPIIPAPRTVVTPIIEPNFFADAETAPE